MKHVLPFLTAFALFALIAPRAYAQTDNIAEGDAAFEAGFYQTAYEYYKEAARNGGSSPSLTYKMAESCRLAHAYRLAIGYYKKISSTNAVRTYTDCDYRLAEMYKCNGQYDSALYYFERYQQSFPSNTTLEKRSHQEIRACQWVLDSAATDHNYAIRHEGKSVNSENGEMAPTYVGDTLLLFSSIRELSKQSGKNSMSTDLVLMQVYQSELARDGKPTEAYLNEWGINSKKQSTSNLAYDPWHRTLYFTRSETDDIATPNCQIYAVSQNEKGKWQKPRKLCGDINQGSYSYTQPAVAYRSDSTVILYFASNRPGGMGGYDLWYTVLKGDTATTCINLGYPINTEGDEITPFYDRATHTLYFSSDWHYGFGGYDIFRSQGETDTWTDPENLGYRINSPANDLFFTVCPTDTNSGFFVSNRSGSFFINGNTCCNDIYHWQIRAPKKPMPPVVAATPQVQHRAEALALLPISLYFHNDEPDPKSKLSTTTQNYFHTYNRYMFMRKQYKDAYKNVADSAQRDSIYAVLDDFFDNEVEHNCLQFEEFINVLIKDMKEGRRVSLTVEGYASPLHTSQYNLILSRRRISTIANQLIQYHDGALTKYLGTDKGSLRLQEVAYGSSHADSTVSTNRAEVSKSVYSVEAARERRIEILDYQYLEDDSSGWSCLRLPRMAENIGTYFTGEVADVEIHIPHNARTTKSVEFLSVGVPEVKIVGYTKVVPGRDLVIYLRMDNRKADPSVSSFLPLTIRIEGEQVTQTMFFEYAIKK